MLVHQRLVDTDVHGLRTVRCVDCGPLHSGSYGRDVTKVQMLRDVNRQAACRFAWLHCDGRCATWD